MNQISARQVTDAVASDQNDVHGVAAMQFTQVNDYTTFRAEFAVTAGDIVFHFFETAEVQALSARNIYWETVFAKELEAVAVRVFNADSTRLRAAYTDELRSWWLRAYGFGHLLDPHRLVYRFLDALDEALDAVKLK